MAAALFSTPPTATIQQSLAHFKEAERLGKPFIENRLFISKCYINMNDLPSAGHWLLQASRIPITTENDKVIIKTVQELMSKYRKYIPQSSS